MVDGRDLIHRDGLGDSFEVKYFDAGAEEVPGRYGLTGHISFCPCSDVPGRLIPTSTFRDVCDITRVPIYGAARPISNFCLGNLS
mmetsp:Transcript_88905/g.144020  ORF Transcript_88905/g.144020 Transcript_88905/m.144020 type:complete len:85 (+) Transcript_88905:45-299(+)